MIKVISFKYFIYFSFAWIKKQRVKLINLLFKETKETVETECIKTQIIEYLSNETKETQKRGDAELDEPCPY